MPIRQQIPFEIRRLSYHQTGDLSFVCAAPAYQDTTNRIESLAAGCDVIDNYERSPAIKPLGWRIQFKAFLL